MTLLYLNGKDLEHNRILAIFLTFSFAEMSVKQQGQPKRLTKENLEEAMSKKSSEDGSVPMPQTTHAQMRRQSKWDPRLTAPMQDRRFSTVSKTSISGTSQTTRHGLPVKLDNTYKLEPDRRFQTYKAEKVMMDVMKEWLTGEEYNSNIRNLTTGITDEIKKRVKNLGFTRYKYVVTVTIYQDAQQSLQMVSRCLWNKDTDNFAEAVFKSSDMLAVATLYALYFE